MPVVGHPSQFLWWPACGLQFPQGYNLQSAPAMLAEKLYIYWKSVFWLAGDRTNGKVLQNLDNSDLLKTEIAYNTSIFTAVTRNHGIDQKSRYTAKITVIPAIVNSWFSYSPSYNAIARLSVVCHVRAPYSAGWNFLQFSSPFGTLDIRRHPRNISWRSSQGNPSVGLGVANIAIITFWRLYRKRCKIAGKLVLITDRKSYMSFRLVPKSMTLNDLE